MCFCVRERGLAVRVCVFVCVFGLSGQVISGIRTLGIEMERVC